jgi:hypothetical protein
MKPGASNWLVNFDQLSKHVEKFFNVRWAGGGNGEWKGGKTSDTPSRALRGPMISANTCSLA